MLNININRINVMAQKMTRRSFVKESARLTAAVTVAGSVLKPRLTAAAPSNAADPMPMGRIGKQEFSRLMLGGNLISGYSHSRDLSYVSALMRRYNTPAKIRETLEIAESHGINVMNLWIMDGITHLREHWKNGGKMKFIAQARVNQNDPLMQFKKAVDEGASAVHPTGDTTDGLVAQGQLGLISKIVEFVRSQGVPAGIGYHGFKALETTIANGIDADFYQKTLHTLDYRSAPRTSAEFGADDLGTWDNAWCRYPETVIDTMAAVRKPFIAFKVLAAGAIKPEVGFPYAVNAGADFLLVGMFDWQIADDVRIAKEAFKKAQRTRPLFG